MPKIRPRASPRRLIPFAVLGDSDCFVEVVRCFDVSGFFEGCDAEFVLEEGVVGGYGLGLEEVFFC